jgi:DNA polymerase-3 subunit delta
MRFKGPAIETFLARPDPRATVVLVYGPDQGLVRERADRLARGIVPDLADPFRVAELPAAELRSDPARLADEAAALAFGGGRRVVRVRDAGDAASGALKSFLADPRGEALVVVEAGDLDARSSLRQLCEASANAAALPCYRDDGRGLDDVVRGQIAEAGLTIAPEALAWLTTHLGTDRMVTRRELEKLVLYMSDRGTDGGRAARIELADAAAVVGDSSFATLDDVTAAAAAGDATALDRALARGLTEIGAVGVLRAAQRHFARLHLALGRIEAGMSPGDAVKAVRPPLFFKAADRFREALSRWTAERAGEALARLVEAEAACKRTGAPDAALCGEALQAVTALAGRRSENRGQRTDIRGRT